MKKPVDVIVKRSPEKKYPRKLSFSLAKEIVKRGVKVTIEKSMKDIVHHYHEILNELLSRRETAGGELSREDEDHFIDVLDRLWNDMTIDELCQASSFSTSRKQEP